MSDPDDWREVWFRNFLRSALEYHVPGRDPEAWARSMSKIAEQIDGPSWVTPTDTGGSP